ncbi:MAG: SLC13 family permease [Candidatus Hadarchaeum sp.]|uniref:SLC13 family permease n=1 Tax=Candidatus Hadarchaeum sp. TaxID=2883567 RepID=UPI00316B05FE
MLLVFVACYGLAISRKVKIVYVSLASAAILLLILLPANVMTPERVLNSIRWDVLGIYWGFMMVSIIFSESGVPDHLARHVLAHTKNEGRALLALCAITAFLSSFLENVGVVLIMAPIAMEIARRTKSPLFLYLISIAISSNMVTTVSMIADPPAIILASEAGMYFMDFYWFQGRLGLGVISAIAAVIGLVALYLCHFRKMKTKVNIEEEEKIEMNYLPTVVFIFGIVALALNSYLRVGPGVIGLIVGVISTILGFKNMSKMIKEFDWNSFFFIIGIFIVIGAVDEVGILGDFAQGISALGFNIPTLTLIILVWLSVALSSFIDNVPYSVLMLPVAKNAALALGSGGLAYPFMYGTLIGTGIGGNITPVGATANVFACGLLEKRGYSVKLKEYLKISLAPTIAAVLVAHLLLQLLWM